MKVYRSTILFIIYFITHIVSFGQSNCASSLKDAEKYYDQGRVEEIPKLLLSCVRSGFSKSQKIRAYELIILSYLTEENYPDAEEYMLKLLKLEPNYVLDKNILTFEFKELYNTISTKPVISIGLIGGVNLTYAQVIEEYTLFDNNSTSGSYTPQVGYQFGFVCYKPINKYLQLNLNLIYERNSYSYAQTDIYDLMDVEYTENQDRFTCPFSIIAGIKQNAITPFIRLGASFDYLVAASIIPNRSFSQVGQSPVTESNLDVMARRNAFNVSFLFGLGLQYQINKTFLFFDCSFKYGFVNQVNSSKRYEDDHSLYVYHILDDDIHQHGLFFSIGLAHSFYRPKVKDRRVKPM